MKKSIKILLLCTIGLSMTAVNASRRDRIILDDGTKWPMTKQELVMTRKEPVNRRTAERNRRRRDNERKFARHQPQQKKISFVRRASSSLLKLLIGAGLGIGTFLAIKNPAVIKALAIAAKNAIFGMFK